MDRFLAVVTVFCVASNPAVTGEPKPLPKPTKEVAFATIGGKQYHAFYGYTITPHAVVAEGTVYCAFQDSHGRPVAAAYDPTTKAWVGPVRASSFGLGRDDHGNPSLYVDRTGHLHIFYGCHGGPMRHTRSAKPYDITAWHEQKPPTRRATYPQSMRLDDGTMHLFYRAGGHMAPWTMRRSADDCKTWSKGTRLIEMRVKPRDPRAAAYCYFFPGADGKTIHCFWNFKDDNRRRRPKAYPNLHEAVYRYNIYYIRMNADGSWTNAAGQPVSLPVSKAEADAACLVFDSGKEFAYPSRLAVDAQNRPYIRIRTGVENWHPRTVIVPMRPKYACRRDGDWRVTDAMPDDWPADVTRVIQARGVAAYGQRPPEWFIFHTYLTPRGTAVFLHNAANEYATCDEGPAALP